MAAQGLGNASDKHKMNRRQLLKGLMAGGIRELDNGHKGYR